MFTGMYHEVLTYKITFVLININNKFNFTFLIKNNFFYIIYELRPLFPIAIMNLSKS